MIAENRYRLLYAQRQLPVFQNRMYDSQVEARSCPTGDLEIVEDIETGLVLNASFRSELLEYDSNYQNEQALSPTFYEHLRTVAKIIESGMGKESLVEVGCGKAFFLEMLQNQGYDISGFDPAYEGNNAKVKKSYFNVDKTVKAKGIILRHVLEHISNPIQFLFNIKAANSGIGKIYIEVPCFDWILRHRAWFDVFYEHVNYFRLSDFDRIFGKVISSGRLFGGQYIYVIADLSTLRLPRIDGNAPLVFPLDFLASTPKPNGRKEEAAIWGASSKGVIYALFRERAGNPIRTLIDINPSKHGKYIPSTGLLVKTPTEALSYLSKGSTIYVMNSNYLGEIKSMAGLDFNYISIDEF